MRAENGSPGTAIEPGESSTRALHGYLADLRPLVLEQIRALVPRDPLLGPILYDLMLDYPLRAAKGLRPALCVATCCALGGSLHEALRSAAVLELYHNAFLIHDDVEDGSDRRRDGPTLHERRGVPVAINVGDAMLALAMGPLVDNVRDVGVGKALRILQLVARMARESAEGQAIELSWIAEGRWDASPRDYARMVHKKSGWYTFVAPMLTGAVLAGLGADGLARVGRVAVPLGVAFQIQDDLLGLLGDDRETGKRRLADLWEGKRTLMLLHAMRTASGDDRAILEAFLERRSRACSYEGGAGGDRAARRRMPAEVSLAHGRLRAAIRGELRRGVLDGELARAMLALLPEAPAFGDDAGAERVLGVLERTGSLEHARRAARRYAERARRSLASFPRMRGSSPHHLFLEQVVGYVVSRTR